VKTLRPVDIAVVVSSPARLFILYASTMIRVGVERALSLAPFLCPRFSHILLRYWTCRQILAFPGEDPKINCRTEKG